jgi:hypothetical protein
MVLTTRGVRPRHAPGPQDPQRFVAVPEDPGSGLTPIKPPNGVVPAPTQAASIPRHTTSRWPKPWWHTDGYTPEHIRCQKHRPHSLMAGAAARWAASPACSAKLREKPSHGLCANLTRQASPSRHRLFDGHLVRALVPAAAAPPAAPIAPPIEACCWAGLMLAHPRWPSGRRR